MAFLIVVPAAQVTRDGRGSDVVSEISVKTNGSFRVLSFTPCTTAIEARSCRSAPLQKRPSSPRRACLNAIGAP